MAVVKRILISGATGSIGGQVISQLPSRGLQVRALVRSSNATGLPPHVEVVQGDLTRPETLNQALDGVETMFLVWVAGADAVAPALQQIAKRVRRIVLLSAPLKTPHPLFQQPNPSRARAELVERLIETSGLDWTFLRPGMFALNALGWWAPQIRAGDVVRRPYLDVPTAPIDERDIAAVAVRTLCEDAHSAAEYVLTGPQSLSQYEQIATIGSVLGRSLRIEEISSEDWFRELPRFLPSLVAKYLVEAWAAAIGATRFYYLDSRPAHWIAGSGVPRVGRRSCGTVPGVILLSLSARLSSAFYTYSARSGTSGSTAAGAPRGNH
jgi:uncharacterized protein YbjT (DUF2867 family)